MRLINIIAIIICTSILINSCTNDNEPKYHKTETSQTNKIDKPTISEIVHTSDIDGFEVIFKVVSDEVPYVVGYYGKNSGKTSSPIINKSLILKCFKTTGKNTYYYKLYGLGFNGGDYIYYYAEASNSKGKTKTSTTFTIIKRTGFEQ